jgi:hypothetical protein
MFCIFDIFGLVLQAHHIPPPYILYGRKNQYATLPETNHSSQLRTVAFFLPPTVCAWIF